MGPQGTSMSKYRLSLTAEEETLFRQIDLSVSHGNHDEQRAAYLGNQKPILALIKSLNERDGIPEHRIRYWADPDYNPGRIKSSRKGLFERNGNQGDEIYTHPSFVRHLRYLLLGSELPAHISEAFERKTGNPEWVNSSDAIDLGKYARKLVRENNMVGSEAAGEFFKLALDIGLSLNEALIILESVKQVR